MVFGCLDISVLSVTTHRINDGVVLSDNIQHMCAVVIFHDPDGLRYARVLRDQGDEPGVLAARKLHLVKLLIQPEHVSDVTRLKRCRVPFGDIGKAARDLRVNGKSRSRGGGSFQHNANVIERVDFIGGQFDNFNAAMRPTHQKPLGLHQRKGTAHRMPFGVVLGHHAVFGDAAPGRIEPKDYIVFQAFFEFGWHVSLVHTRSENLTHNRVLDTIDKIINNNIDEIARDA